ncbi:MAG: hypothetical protein AO394_02930 [Candidatus Fermentibacter daniensis]|nr:MAG: hypothetical protein AO394_02930 [Candidatus Fermentibacter daniensis]
MPQSEDRHREIAPATCAAEFDERLQGHSEQIQVWLEIAAEQFGRELVVAGRDRSVRGEDVPCYRQFTGFAEAQTLSHELPDPFQYEECRVTLVGVADGGP